MTDYPVQPTYQRYFGKVKRAMNQQSITPRRVRQQAAVRQAYSAHPFQWSQWYRKLPGQTNMDNNFNVIEGLQNKIIAMVLVNSINAWLLKMK